MEALQKETNVDILELAKNRMLGWMNIGIHFKK